MKKSPILIFIATIFFAAIGCCLRMLQLSRELLPNGFLAEGSYLHIVLLILTAVFLVGLALLLRPLEQRESWRNAFCTSPVGDILLLVAALAILVGNLLLWVSGNELSNPAIRAPEMITLLNGAQPFMGLISAGCVAAFAITRLLGKKPSPIFFMAVSLWLVVRLIVGFQSWNTDPSIHVYGYRLAAAICTMLGSFQFAGFSFDKGKRRISLFWCLSAVFFCGISAADGLGAVSTAEFLLNFSLQCAMIAAAIDLLFCPASQPEAPEDEAELPCD